jgi:hypothetical protein
MLNAIVMRNQTRLSLYHNFIFKNIYAINQSLLASSKLLRSHQLQKNSPKGHLRSVKKRED